MKNGINLKKVKREVSRKLIKKDRLINLVHMTVCLHQIYRLHNRKLFMNSCSVSPEESILLMF